jgi:uncharacterized membrane protein
MEDLDKRIEQLSARLENLFTSQEQFQREITQIRYEINALRAAQQKQSSVAQSTVPKAKPPVREYVPPQKEQTAPPPFTQKTSQKDEAPKFEIFTNQPAARKEKSDLEKFIGENLISKIGIVILIIGVGIGAKYAIDNDLISPLGRIIIGYAFGFGLLGFAVKLKAKYLNFSAVLLSGAMAIMYFITFFAYSLYGLFDQSTAFVLMLIFTVFTVVSAINYSRQVIAHIGLVGAYAIPFLLSNDSGNYAFLFSYIAVINVGILALSVKKYWISLFYSSFVFTWLIYSAWYFSKYAAEANFNLALFFATAFFLIFYLTFLAYKLISKEDIRAENVALITANSFIFYGLGYSILESRAGFEDRLGLFTVGNAAVHFAFAFAVSRLKNVSRNLVYLLSALVLTFITIAVSVQFDGNYITLIWAAEAANLFWIGRTKTISLYENYSFPLMILASVSLLKDWANLYLDHSSTTEMALAPIFNSYFATAIFFVAAFAFINYINRRKEFEPTVSPQLIKLTNNALPAILLVVLYNTFRIEIGNYYHFQYVKTAVVNSLDQNLYNSDLNLFNLIWQINYTMLFLSVLAFANILKFKSAVLGFVNLGLNFLILLVFLAGGLLILGELRENYLLQNAPTFPPTFIHILIRYISYAFAAALIYSIYKYFRQEFIKKNISERDSVYAFDFLFYASVLWILSSELINWMDIFGYKDSYKLGLSIFWGIYALALIILGISRHKKHLRVGAIVLFAATLAKLFLYDIAELGTISKTVVFVSLGILLLIISFLYTKYRNLIFETDELQK